jgi:hypothetical protein
MLLPQRSPRLKERNPYHLPRGFYGIRCAMESEAKARVTAEGQGLLLASGLFNNRLTYE